MVGTSLVPLSALAALDPELYARSAARYSDRPGIMQRRVEPLDCAWSDCVFLSPVHPSILCDAVRSARPDWPQREWFEIDAATLDPGRAVLFRPSAWTSEVPPSVTADQCEAFTISALRRASEPSSVTIGRLRDPANRLPLWADVMHVLYRGSIDVSNARVIVA